MAEILMHKYEVFGVKAKLGENPLWDGEKFRYLDINSKRAYIYDLGTDEYEYTDLPDKAGSMALCEDGSVVYAMVDGIYDSTFKMICEKPTGSGIRFNDGKPSPDGRYFVGTVEKGGNGALFCLENGKLSTAIPNVRVSNGLDWSGDGKTLFYCDTPTRKIVAYSYPSMTYVRTVIDFSAIDGFTGNPDGLCIDAEDNLWIAIWNGGKAVKVNTATGKIVDEIVLPVKFVSCPVFADKDLKTLVLTSASDDGVTDDSEYAGMCFKVRLSVGGREPYRIKLKNLKEN